MKDNTLTASTLSSFESSNHLSTLYFEMGHPDFVCTLGQHDLGVVGHTSNPSNHPVLNLPDLVYLAFTDNGLTGSIPSSIIGLTKSTNSGMQQHALQKGVVNKYVSATSLSSFIDLLFCRRLDCDPKDLVPFLTKGVSSV